MPNSLYKKLLAATFAAALIASPALAQHRHDENSPEHNDQQDGEGMRMGMEGHHMMDGMPHFMAQGEHAEAVKAALTAYAAAAEDGSVEGMAAQVIQSDDFTIIEGSHPNWGWADYRDNHLKPEFSSDEFHIKSYKYDDFRISAMPMISYATFKIFLEATVRGEDVTRERMGTAILVKTKEGWRIRHLHTS